MASKADIGAELKRLLDTLPAPRGVVFDKAFEGYCTALAPFSAAEIAEAINRYLSAEWPDISLKYYPRAPELAHIVRLVRAEHWKIQQAENRRAQIERDRAEWAEAEKLRDHTPESKARIAALVAGFHESVQDEEMRQRIEAQERARAEVRARYGMTDEVLAGVKERPLPKGMKKLADAAPALPPAPPPQPPDFGDLP